MELSDGSEFSAEDFASKFEGIKWKPNTEGFDFVLYYPVSQGFLKDSEVCHIDFSSGKPEYTPFGAMEKQMIFERNLRTKPYSGLNPEDVNAIRYPIYDRKDLDLQKQIYGPNDVRCRVRAKGVDVTFRDGQELDRSDQYFLICGDRVLGSSNRKEDLQKFWDSRISAKRQERNQDTNRSRETLNNRESEPAPTRKRIKAAQR